MRKLQRLPIGSRYITIQKAKTKAGSKTTTPIKCLQGKDTTVDTVYVKGLPYDLDEDSVEEVFSKFGPVKEVRLSRWGHTGKLKGFGYVDFEKDSGAVAKLALWSEPLYVHDRVCEVDCENVGKAKGGFKHRKK